jgi:hypothetical protein
MKSIDQLMFILWTASNGRRIRAGSRLLPFLLMLNFNCLYTR